MHFIPAFYIEEKSAICSSLHGIYENACILQNHISIIGILVRGHQQSHISLKTQKLKITVDKSQPLGFIWIFLVSVHSFLSSARRNGSKCMKIRFLPPHKSHKRTTAATGVCISLTINWRSWTVASYCLIYHCILCTIEAQKFRERKKKLLKKTISILNFQVSFIILHVKYKSLLQLWKRTRNEKKKKKRTERNSEKPTKCRIDDCRQRCIRSLYFVSFSITCFRMFNTSPHKQIQKRMSWRAGARASRTDLLAKISRNAN